MANTLQETDIYSEAKNPTANVNPKKLGAVWINYTTGDTFVCSNNTHNRNIWVQTNKKMLDAMQSEINKTISNFKTTVVTVDGLIWRESVGTLFYNHLIGGVLNPGRGTPIELTGIYSPTTVIFEYRNWEQRYIFAKFRVTKPVLWSHAASAYAPASVHWDWCFSILEYISHGRVTTVKTNVGGKLLTIPGKEYCCMLFWGRGQWTTFEYVRTGWGNPTYTTDKGWHYNRFGQTVANCGGRWDAAMNVGGGVYW